MTRYEEIQIDCMRKDSKNLQSIAESLKIIADCMQEQSEKEKQAERYGFFSNECRRGVLL